MSLAAQLLIVVLVIASPTLSAAYVLCGIECAAAPTLAPLRSATVFLQEAEGAKAAEPPAKVMLGTDSPLTSFAAKDAEMTLEEFNRKKTADNTARDKVRARNNVLIPVVCAIAYAVALFIGEDNLKANLQEMGSDPLGNTPGMAETRERKAKGLAIAAEKQDKAARAVRSAIRGEEAVEEAEKLQAQE